MVMVPRDKLYTSNFPSVNCDITNRSTPHQYFYHSYGNGAHDLSEVFRVCYLKPFFYLNILTRASVTVMLVVTRAVGRHRNLSLGTVFPRVATSGRQVKLLVQQEEAGCWVFRTSRRIWRHSMMTSSNGNIFRVTGPLCGEFTGDRWIPLTKASDAEVWCFLSSVPE